MFSRIIIHNYDNIAKAKLIPYLVWFNYIINMGTEDVLGQDGLNLR